MVFCGAESGSDEVLVRMNKGITTDQILTVAAKTRQHGVIPEFSFIFGDPDEPEVQLQNTIAFIRKLKAVNPQMELISYFYTPTPQRKGTYGDVDAREGTPDTLEEWIEPEWVGWMTHENPQLPWFEQKLHNWSMEYRIRTATDRTRWILSRGQVFYEPSGKPKRMVGINVDITSRRCAGAPIQRTEARLRTGS